MAECAGRRETWTSRRLWAAPALLCAAFVLGACGDIGRFQTAAPDFGASTEQWFPWTRAYLRDQWLDLLLSYSDHAALEPMVRDRLFEAIGAAIDDYGGSFVMSFETVLITATRLG